jgi:Holliday junction resolvase
VRESDLERWAVAKARKQGWWARKFASPQRRSAPDYIFGNHGDVFWVEFKATNGRVTPLQQQEHVEMLNHGLRVFVCWSKEDFEVVLGLYGAH